MTSFRTSVIEADLVARGLRVALLASRFNHFIVDRLVEGATGLREAPRRRGHHPGARARRLGAAADLPDAAPAAGASTRSWRWAR
jgi:6,7-dimethyl-8-ribityllumazine synthase